MKFCKRCTFSTEISEHTQLFKWSLMFLLTAPVRITQSLITGLCRFIRWPVIFPPEQRQGVNQLLCTLSRRSASLPDQPSSTNICLCLSQTQLDTSAACHRPGAFAFDHTEIGKVQCVCICQCVHTTVARRLHIQSWCWCSSNRVAGRLHRGYAVNVLELSYVRGQQSWWILCLHLEESRQKIDLPWDVFFFSLCFASLSYSFNSFKHYIHKQIETIENVCCLVCYGLIWGILAHYLW